MDQPVPVDLDEPTRDAADLLHVADRHSTIAAHPVGKIFLALVTVVMATWIVLPNLPNSAFRERIEPVYAPATELGLMQNWYVFSPNPLQESFEVSARIEYRDGTVTDWTVPAFNPTVGGFRQYRWNKWESNLRADVHEGLWEPTAAWLAREYARNGESPVRVTLIRSSQDHHPLGSDPLDGQWSSEPYYVWEPDQ